MPTILLVERIHNLASVIIRELEKEQYRVIHASDGPRALRLHQEEHPDIIILDWMLPGVDRLTVMRTIHLNASTPILMLTARGKEVTGNHSVDNTMRRIREKLGVQSENIETVRGIIA